MQGRERRCDEGGAGIIVYDFMGQVEMNTGNVTVNGGEGESFGMDLVTEEGGQLSVTVEGDVSAEGDSGAGIRVRGAEKTREASQGEISILVDGTVSGPDAAIELIAGQERVPYDTDFSRPRHSSAESPFP